MVNDIVPLQNELKRVRKEKHEVEQQFNEWKKSSDPMSRRFVSWRGIQPQSAVSRKACRNPAAETGAR